VYFKTSSLRLLTWKAVSLTVLRACANQVDDVLVPPNILHRVHFRQEVSQLILSSISWKIRQITDLKPLAFTPCFEGQLRSESFVDPLILTAFNEITCLAIVPHRW